MKKPTSIRRKRQLDASTGKAPAQCRIARKSVAITAKPMDFSAVIRSFRSIFCIQYLSHANVIAI